MTLLVAHEQQRQFRGPQVIEGFPQAADDQGRGKVAVPQHLRFLVHTVERPECGEQRNDQDDGDCQETER
jgi:hypothetical protein